MSPLQVSVGMTFHRKFGSKNNRLCDDLGFSSLYHEAQLYKASSASEGISRVAPGTFVEFSADNSDFNVSILNDEGTFHNLG